MKLLTKKITDTLSKFPIGSQDGKGGDAKIIVKFFNPCGAGTWYVLEGEQQADGDWMFFGIVDLHCREYGYFTLSQLTNVRLPFGMCIERDMYFDNKCVKDLNSYD